MSSMLRYKREKARMNKDRNIRIREATRTGVSVDMVDNNQPSVVSPLTNSQGQERTVQNHYVDCLKKHLLLHRGLLLVLAVCLIGAYSAMVYKMLAGHVPVLEIAFCRQLSIFLQCTPFLLVFKITFRITFRNAMLVIVMIVFTTVSDLTTFYAIEIIPAADVIAILLSSPIFTGILARILLREKYSIIDAVLALVTLIGVTLIARPSFIFGNFSNGTQESGNIVSLGVIAALTGAVSNSLCILVIRKLSTANVHPIYQHWLTAFGGCILNGAITTVFGSWELPGCSMERVKLIITGFFGFACGTLFRYALKFEKAVNVDICSTNIVVFSFIFEFLIFDTVPHWLSVLGAGLIMCSAVGITINKIKYASHQDRRSIYDEQSKIERESDSGNG